MLKLWDANSRAHIPIHLGRQTEKKTIHLCGKSVEFSGIGNPESSQESRIEFIHNGGMYVRSQYTTVESFVPKASPMRNLVKIKWAKPIQYNRLLGELRGLYMNYNYKLQLSFVHQFELPDFYQKMYEVIISQAWTIDLKTCCTIKAARL